MKKIINITILLIFISSPCFALTECEQKQIEYIQSREDYEKVDNNENKEKMLQLDFFDGIIDGKIDCKLQQEKKVIDTERYRMDYMIFENNRRDLSDAKILTDKDIESMSDDLIIKKLDELDGTIDGNIDYEKIDEKNKKLEDEYLKKQEQLEREREKAERDKYERELKIKQQKQMQSFLKKYPPKGKDSSQILSKIKKV